MVTVPNPGDITRGDTPASDRSPGYRVPVHVSCPGSYIVAVPRELVEDDRLSAAAIGVAAYILSFTGKPWPTEREIGKGLGMRPREVRFAVGDLIVTGWLEAVQP